MAHFEVSYCHNSKNDYEASELFFLQVVRKCLLQSSSIKYFTLEQVFDITILF